MTIKGSKQKPASRIIAIFLIMMILVSIFLDAKIDTTLIYGTDETNTGGFVLSLSWNANNNAADYVYDTDLDENRLIRLNVEYSNKTVSEFKPGEIIITVPGIGAGYRGQIMQAEDVAADKASDTTKIHEWSYTYNPSNDTYTFTNNKAIEANSTFAGSFEIVWRFYSRETKQGYSANLTAKLRAAGNVETVSNQVTYTQTRVKDLYKITETAEKLHSAEGFDAGLNVDDYFWVRYQSEATRQRKSLAVETYTEYYIYKIPEDGIIVYANGYNFSKTGQTETIDGVEYTLWKVEEIVDKDNHDVNTANIVVAYPRTTYADKEITQYVQIYGRYYEDSAVSVLAETSVTIAANDYDFIDLPGDIYDVEKDASGIGGYTQFASGHSNYSYTHGYINARDMFASSAKNQYTFYLEGLLNYRAPEADSYDLEFVDDFIDVELKTGELRQLRPDEYEFKTITIPSNSSLKNINGVAIKADTYKVNIYVMKIGDNDFVLFDDTRKITDYAQTISFPENTYKIKIEILGMAESITGWSIPVTVQFRSSDDEIKTDGGKIINNMFFKLYVNKASEGKVHDWFNNNFGSDTYINNSNIDTYQRDIDEYGASFDRESAQLYILERPNFYYNATVLDSFSAVKSGFNSNATLRTTFDYMDGEELTSFSMYTILPEGTELSTDIIDVDAFYEKLSLSNNLELSESFLMNHLTVEIIKNYQGSTRTYIALHFDFVNTPVIMPKGGISVTFPVYLSNENYQKYGGAYSLYGASMVNDSGLIVNPSRYARVDNGGYSDDSVLWNDINRNGNTAEQLSQDISHQTLIYAVETSLQMTKFVATETTGWNYVQPDKQEDGTYIEEQIPIVESNGDYTYKVRLKTGSSKAKDIVYFDVLETGPLAEWQGTFQSVDINEALELLSQQNGREITATVYYSTLDYSAAIAASEDNYVPDFTTPDWTTVKPAGVKTIAVSFGSAILDPDSYLSLYVNMKAPECTENSPLVNKITENNYNIYYTPVDKITEMEMPKVWLPSNDVPVKIQSCALKLYLEKSDETGNIVAGATFDFYKQLGAQPNKDTDKKLYTGLMTDARGMITIRNIDQGKYYFIETKAPNGYILSSDPIKVDLANNNQTVKVVNTRKPGQVLLKKVNDRDNNIAVPNAVFTLYQSDGTVYRDDITTGNDGSVAITGIPWGSYYLQEKSAPDGYVLNNNQYPFTISADKDNGSDPAIIKLSNIVAVNEQIPASVVMTKYEVLEDGTTRTAVKLDGAAYKLYRASDNKELGTYMTDENGEIYAGDLTFGSYYFLESIAARGYALNTNKISFTVDATHTSQSLRIETTNQRLKGNVWLQKLDNSNNYVKNAVFGLYNAGTNTLIGQKTTDSEGIIEFTNLNWGSYYIKEIQAPKGYELDPTEHQFTISSQTVNDRIILNLVNEQLKGSVKLIKVDENNENTKLQGAVFNLYKTDGTIYRSNLKTDVNGVLIVDGIEWGSYYFQEIEAPQGYGLNPDKIRFSVNYLTGGVIQEITVTDPALSKELTLTKRIKISDIVFAHGNPMFTFCLAGTDINGNSHTYYKTVNFSQAYLDQYLKDNPGAEYIEQSVIFTGLLAGEYTASEIDVIRYKFEETAALSANAKINDETVDFDINTADNGCATFVNKKTDQSGTSHTAVVTNILKTRKLTAVIVDYNGSETLSSTAIDRSQLDVYAVYDDGTQVKLDNNAYSIEGLPSSTDDGISGEYTVNVVYTDDNNITKKDSFTVTIDIPPMFTWTVDDTNNTATFTKYLGSSTILNIPDKVVGTRTTETNYSNNGKTYTVIGIKDFTSALSTNFFKTSTTATSVVQIIFPNTLTHIGNYAFTGLTKLQNIKIPDSVKTIGNYTFYNSTTASTASGTLSIGSGVTSIGNYAFYNCYGLTGAITISDNVTSIGEYAFTAANTTNPMKFTSIKIGSNVKTIGQCAFRYCSNAAGNLTIPSSVTSIGASAFYGCYGFKGNLTLENGIDTIGDSAFYNCYGFTGVLSIPNSVTSIGNSAFNNCYGFNGKLSISTAITAIADYTFYNCYGLTNALEIPDNVISIGEYAFAAANETTPMKFTSIKIGNKVSTIGQRAFRYCSKAAGTLTIPSSVTSIGAYAFYNCYSLTGALTIPDNVTSIGEYAFAAVYDTTPMNFTSIKIGSKVSTIGQRAFRYCSMATGTLTIPSSVTSIGAYAFYNCYGLTGTLSIPGSVTEIGDYAFASVDYTNFMKFSAIILNNGIQKIGTFAFRYNLNASGTLTIPSSVTSIGDYAFFNCYNFTSLVFSANSKCTTIGIQAFYYCSKFSGNVYVPVSVTSIGTSAFDLGQFLQNGNTLVDATYMTLYLPARFAGNKYGYLGTVYWTSTQS